MRLHIKDEAAEIAQWNIPCAALVLREGKVFPDEAPL